jgi:hypothetical protein
VLALPDDRETASAQLRAQDVVAHHFAAAGRLCHGVTASATGDAASPGPDRHAKVVPSSSGCRQLAACSLAYVLPSYHLSSAVLSSCVAGSL